MLFFLTYQRLLTQFYWRWGAEWHNNVIMEYFINVSTGSDFIHVHSFLSILTSASSSLFEDLTHFIQQSFFHKGEGSMCRVRLPLPWCKIFCCVELMNLAWIRICCCFVWEASWMTSQLHGVSIWRHYYIYNLTTFLQGCIYSGMLDIKSWLHELCSLRGIVLDVHCIIVNLLAFALKYFLPSPFFTGVQFQIHWLWFIVIWFTPLWIDACLVGYVGHSVQNAD